MSKTIKEQVEARLIEQQKSKEFKDVGRVEQTRKEKSAYKFIDSTVLDQLEQDKVMAYNMVKKENVWPPIDVNLEREKGVESGAAFLKVQIRAAAPTRPADDANKRSSYVRFLGLLQNDLEPLKTIEEIRAKIASYKDMDIYNIIGYFMDAEFFNKTEEQKAAYQEILITKNYNLKWMYESKRLVQKLLEEVFSKKFANLLYRYSDAAKITWKEAQEKNGITEQESVEKIKTYNQIHKENQERLENRIEQAKQADKQSLLNQLKNWTFTSFHLNKFKANIEEFRQWLIERYARESEQAKQNQSKLIDKQKAQPADWTWFEKEKKSSSENVVKEPSAAKRAINTKTPLSYVKRTGGYKVIANTPEQIVSQFGFKAVNYGVYVDDKWSKDHTGHFLGAMSDLSEVLNIDIKKVNELGGLSIAFGAKGRKGHAAAYFPQTKDINLTKSNGDGSVAHEWGHYLDNFLSDGAEKSAIPRFATQGKAKDRELIDLFKEFMDFVHKGKAGVTPLMPVTFYAKAPVSDAVPTFKVYNKQQGWFDSVEVEIKDTIEKTLEQAERLFVIDQSMYQTQLRVFGYIIHKFGLESYNIPMRLKTSYFYHTTAYELLQYCYKQSETSIVVNVVPRSKYWTSEVELFARAFESVVLHRLIKEDRVSNYLVADIPTGVTVSESYNEPYPQGAELEYLDDLIFRIIAAFKTTYSVGSFKAPSEIKEDEYTELQEKTGKTKDSVKIDTPPNKEEVVIFESEEEVKVVVEEPAAQPESPKNENYGESIPELIAGLEVLLDITEGEERETYAELIEGLKLLV